MGGALSVASAESVPVPEQDVLEETVVVPTADAEVGSQTAGATDLVLGGGIFCGKLRPAAGSLQPQCCHHCSHSYPTATVVAYPGDLGVLPEPLPLPAGADGSCARRLSGT